MSYERPAPYYDLFCAKDDGAFLADVAARTGGPVLAAAAGTGRETITLAEAGLDVVAFDTSPAMLAVAAGKVAARKLGRNVRLIRADARRFQFRQRFPLVVAVNLFDHFVSDEDAGAFFRHVKIHLAPGGRAVVNASTTGWRPPASPGPEERPLEGGRRVTRLVKYSPTTRRNVYAVELWFDVWRGDQRLERMLERTQIRLFRPDELRRLAAGVGLTVDATYADFAASPFAAGDGHAVYVFK